MFQDFIGKASAKLEAAKGTIATALNQQITSMFTSNCTPIPFEQKFQIDPNVKRSDDVSFIYDCLRFYLFRKKRGNEIYEKCC